MRNRTTTWVLTLAFSVLPLATPRIAQAADDAPAPPSPPPSLLAPNDAPHPRAFGSRGVLTIGSDASASIEEQISQESHFTFLEVQPSVDYFVADRLSLGIALLFSYNSEKYPTEASRSFVFGAGPRVGYDIPLSDHFSLWPKASVFFEHSTLSFSGPSEPEGGSGYAFLEPELFVPVLYHPAAHFFVGFGPYAAAVIPVGPGTTPTELVGAKLTLGGWVGT